MKQFDVIVIGAGAAGLMCAFTAGQRGRRVLLLDRAEKIGKKILISGGGRCNFTNLWVEPANFLSQNPHFCKSALSRYTPYDFIDLVEKHSIAYHEKTLGQLFCDDSARQIVEMLLTECEQGKVQIQTRCTVKTISQQEVGFRLTTSLGSYQTESLVIATGGLSIPKMGATGFGYAVAKQFGLKVVPCQAGLVALTVEGKLLKMVHALAGISVEAVVSGGGQVFREAVLFTHQGLSGPAILQISNYWQPGQAITINLLPKCNLAVAIKKWQQERPKTTLKIWLNDLLPRRLVQTWLTLVDEGDKPVNQYNDREIAAIAQLFHAWQIYPSGTTGYGKAEVTKGGVDTAELSSKTFEAKAVPGLYFIGEVVDVTGWLGGYNFQWAWASGHCAGETV